MINYDIYMSTFTFFQVENWLILCAFCKKWLLVNLKDLSFFLKQKTQNTKNT